VADGSDDGKNAERSIAKEKDRNLPHDAGRCLKPGFAGKPHRRVLDHEIAQIERIAEGGRTQRNQYVGGAR